MIAIFFLLVMFSLVSTVFQFIFDIRSTRLDWQMEREMEGEETLEDRIKPTLLPYIIPIRRPFHGIVFPLLPRRYVTRCRGCGIVLRRRRSTDPDLPTWQMKYCEYCFDRLPDADDQEEN